MDQQIGLFDAIHTQRAIRSFRPDPVPRDQIVTIVEAATKAPSGGNAQPWAFVVVEDPALLARMAVFARRGFGLMKDAAVARMRPGDPPPYPRLERMIESFEQIPVLIVVCHEGSPGTVPHPARYGSVFPAVQNLLLAARGLGLGAALTSGWAMSSAAEISALLNLPEHIEPLAFVPVGYPDRERYGPTTRRPVEEVLHWNSWTERGPSTARIVHR